MAFWKARYCSNFSICARFKQGIEEKNSQLAYQIIRDIGVFLPARIQQPSSPYDSDTRVKQIMGEFVKIGLENRNRIYGTPMPEIEAAAARAGVKIHLNSAPLDDEECEEGTELTSR